MEEQPLWIQKRLGIINWNDVKDRTVLDIGCNDGLITNKAKEMGASRVVGVDILKGQLKVASDAAKEQGLDVEYWNLDVESKEFYNLAGSFDVIFFMAMINHMKNGAKMLEWISDHCKKYLYFGTNFFNKKEVQIEKVKHYTSFNEIVYLGESGNIPDSYHLFRCYRIGKQYLDPNLDSIPTTFIDIDRLFRSSHPDQIESDLETSIKNIGIKEPITVRRATDAYFEEWPLEKGREFIGCEGGNRFLTMRKLGYKSIPCKIIG